MVLRIDPEAKVSLLADIEDSVRGSKITIGAGTTIDSFVKIKPAGGAGDVVFGERCSVNSGCVFYSGNGLTIGNFVSIAANCVFAPVNHEYQDRNQLIQNQGFQTSRGGIVIEDDVWIGSGCVFLDGAIVRRGAVIGAMSLVRGEIPEYSVVAGSGLNPIGHRT